MAVVVSGFGLGALLNASQTGQLCIPQFACLMMLDVPIPNLPRTAQNDLPIRPRNHVVPPPTFSTGQRSFLSRPPRLDPMGVDDDHLSGRWEYGLIFHAGEREGADSCSDDDAAWGRDVEGMTDLREVGEGGDVRSMDLAAELVEAGSQVGKVGRGGHGD